MTQISYAELDGPEGRLGVAWREDTILAIDFGASRGRVASLMGRRFGEVMLVDTPLADGPGAALGDYFAGDLHALDGVAADPGGTPFQASVWRLLREIPVGETRSYGELAQALRGTPGASRAVGRANGQNPIPLVIPCHRVIGADGTLTGFGGGMAWKAWLLGHEGVPIQGSLV
jgi:methylated-DNA-[protein]-cysteine S-methyltransferase